MGAGGGGNEEDVGNGVGAGYTLQGSCAVGVFIW